MLTYNARVSKYATLNSCGIVPSQSFSRKKQTLMTPTDTLLDCRVLYTEQAPAPYTKGLAVEALYTSSTGEQYQDEFVLYSRAKFVPQEYIEAKVCQRLNICPLIELESESADAA